MFTKKINLIILVLSQILNFVIILYFAVLLAKFVWWVINPSISDVYVEKDSVMQFDKISKYIINRYPFGVVVKHVEVKPKVLTIAEQIKLTGVYFNPPKDNIAFIEYNNVSKLLRVGDKIMDSDATIMAINMNSIVILENQESAVVNISQGSGATSNKLSGSDNFASKIDSTTFPINNSNTDRHSHDEFRERRKKIIGEFLQKESSTVERVHG